MTADTISTGNENRKVKVIQQSGASGAVYGLGMIGAWVYYVSHASTFLIGALGILKGIFWPAILVYEALKFMGL